MHSTLGLGAYARRQLALVTPSGPAWKHGIVLNRLCQVRRQTDGRRGFAAHRSRKMSPTLLHLPSPSIQQAGNAPMMGAFILPGTLVPPTILRSLRKQGVVEGSKIQWVRLRTRVMDWVRRVGMHVASKPTWLSAARFKARRGTIVPTAKALHQTMSEALAAGDRQALRKVCVPVLYNELEARIARRPRGHRYEWQILGHTQPLLYPRIVDHKVLMLPTPGSGQLSAVHQAVVALSTRQRLVTYDDAKGGAVVPGSEKEVEVVENLILTRPVDCTTYKAGEWAIFGHADETTYQDWLDEKRALAEAQM